MPGHMRVIFTFLGIFTFFQSALCNHVTLGYSYSTIEVQASKLPAWVDEQVAFLLDMDGQVYTTNNAGFSWTKVDAIQIAISSIVVSRVSGPPSVFFNGLMLGATSSPKSVTWDGTSYRTVTTPIYFSDVAWHPTQLLTLFGSGVVGVTGRAEIHVSSDGGQTWNLITSVAKSSKYVTWGNAGMGTIPPSRLYYIEYSGNPTMAYTDDWGSTSVSLIGSANDFAFGQNFLLVGVVDSNPPTDDPLDTMLLYVSRDYGYGNGVEVSMYNRTRWPFDNDLPVGGYKVLDEATGVWIGVSYESLGGHFGNLYQSDRYGMGFTEELSFISSSFGQSGVTFDYTILPGYGGSTIVANTVRNWGQLFDGGPKSLDIMVTWITYDAGGQWQPLQGTIAGCPITTESCRLHLHGPTTTGPGNDFDAIKASSNAIGIVIGTGNEGDYLSFETVYTYVSRDTGRTWAKVGIPSGPFISQISAGGGVILFVPKSGFVLYYSYDAGATVTPYIFANQTVRVENVETDPEHLGQNFYIYGREENTNVPFLRAITFDLPGCGTSQTESWTPSECVLGQTVTYVRKIPSAECSFPSLYNSKVVAKCDCTRDDFECAYGYKLNPTENTCDETGTVDIPKGPPTVCPPGKQYEVPSGYRLIPGDQCENGVASQYAPKLKDCPTVATPASPTSRLLIAAISFAVALLVFLVIGLLSLRSQRVRDRLPEALLAKLPSWLVGGYVPSALGDDEEYGTAVAPDLLIHSDQEDEEPEELDDSNIDRVTKTKEKPLFELESKDDDFNPRLGE